MADRTWIGGAANNDAGDGANWSPAGAPRNEDNLNVISGTLEIGPRDLAGNTLHMSDPYDANVGGFVGTGVTLDVHGTRAAIDGSLNFGDSLTINTEGNATINAAGGFDAIFGSINLAANSHLVTTGSMSFGYGGTITGGSGSRLTNNGMIALTNGHVDVPVNGNGTLGLVAYHSARGAAEISAPIAATQTVELESRFEGVTLTLNDPGDFRGLLKIDPPFDTHEAMVVVSGVHADSVAVVGPNRIMLTDGGKAVDLLRVADAGSMQIALSDDAAGTTLTFHAPTAS